MITQVTEKETQLSHMLTVCTEALKSMTAERDDALYAGRLIVKRCDRLVQERDSNARLFLEDIKTVEAERDALKEQIAGWKADQKENLRNQCELVGLYQKAAAENKVLRDALERTLWVLETEGAMYWSEIQDAARAALGETK